MEKDLFVWSTLNFWYVNLKAVGLYLQVPLSSSLFLFLYILLFLHDFYMDLILCFISVYFCATKHLSSSFRFPEISSVKWFCFASSYRKFIYVMETSLLSRSSSFSLEGLYYIPISADISSNKNSFSTII